MSVADLKVRLANVPGIETLTMQLIAGRLVFGFNGLIAAVDPLATDQEIETAIRHTAELARFGRLPKVPFVAGTERQASMSTPARGGFAASLRAMMDEARAGVEQARSDGLETVKAAVGKLNDAKVATVKVAGQMASTIENEAADVLAELGQISNDLGTE